MGWNIARVQSYIVRGSFYAALPKILVRKYGDFYFFTITSSLFTFLLNTRIFGG